MEQQKVVSVVSDDMAAALPRGDQLWPVAQDTVAQWWATYGKHVPLLASVERLMLAQPVSLIQLLLLAVVVECRPKPK